MGMVGCYCAVDGRWRVQRVQHHRYRMEAAEVAAEANIDDEIIGIASICITGRYSTSQRIERRRH